jgi:hypothetical protein
MMSSRIVPRILGLDYHCEFVDDGDEDGTR